MGTTVTFLGQQFSVGPSQEESYTEVLTQLTLPVHELRSVEVRKGLEQRFQSTIEIQFAMLLDIEYDGDPAVIEDCIEMFRHAGLSLRGSPLEYRETYVRYEAISDYIEVAFEFNLVGWKIIFAVLCPRIHTMTDELPDPAVLNETYLRFATEEALSTLLHLIAPSQDN